MSPKVSSLLAAGAALLASSAFAFNVATVYSSWPGGNKSFFREFDASLEKLGYKFQKFENTKIPELTEKLADFDLVAVTSTGNYDNTVELKPYAEAWRKYIENGGMLFICDANYTSVLNSFVNYLGPDFKIFAQHCTSHTKPAPGNGVETPCDHSLMSFPAPVFKTANIGHWCHFTGFDKSWIPLETCVDNKPITIAKPCGKGLVVLTVHSSLKPMSSGAFLQDILTNMAAYTELNKLGLAVVSAKMPSGVPQDSAAIVVKADSAEKAKALGLKLEYTTLNGFKEVRADAKVKGKSVALDIPRIAYDCRSQITVKTSITMDDKTVMAGSATFQLPEYLEFKARRVHLYPDMPRLTLSFNVAPANTKAKRALTWNFDDAPAQSLAISKNDFTHAFDVTALALGGHVLNMTYTEDGKAINSYKQPFFRHDTATFGIRADGTLLHKGQPFFPMGFYHVSWKETLEDRMNMVKDIAQYGYNCVHVSIKGTEKDTETYTEFLDECAKRGIFVITEFGYTPLEVIKRYKNHPAILGWNPGDEPAAAGISHQEMFRRYTGFKQEDPNHIAYTVICMPKQYKNYASGSDILAPDPYPIPSGHADAVFGAYSSAYAEARKYDTTLWAVPQCFGGYTGWKRPPTAHEYRAMMYLAIMAGVKGFVNYTYRDGGFFLPQSPDLYEACKTLPAEIKDFIPFILNGKRTILQSDARGIYTAVWELDGKRAYAVVNASDNDLAKPLSFQIKGNFKKCTVAAGKLDGMEATGKNLKATLAPMERALLFCK